jgi:hypothetical protein
LTDKLFDLFLCLDIERVLVEQLDLVAALPLSFFLLALPVGKDFYPRVGIHDSGGEFRILQAQASYTAWVT